MGKTLKFGDNAPSVAEIVRHGEKLILPKDMTIPSAIDLLKRRQKFEEETVNVSETFLAFPQDGAYAMDKVLTDMFGWTPAEPIPGFFGDTPPQMMTIEVDVNKHVQVPWGRFSLPTVDGWVQTQVTQKEGRICFALAGEVKRHSEATIVNFFERIREYLATHSIYRGKAVKIRFRDDDGELIGMPEPKFLDTRDIKRDSLIYSKDVQQSVETNFFTPMERVKDCLANGIPVKRGILLGGPYGTGKTLAAHVGSKIAVDNGLTFIYITRANELADAINFSKLYGDPAAVLFCEDIDRAVYTERTVKIDEILNIIDGIDSKRQNLITVLTTNHLENINAAMLRPGRLDAIIEVTPPDAEAAERLLRWYGGEAIAPEEDLSEASQKLAGTIPATIAEVVKRAKLAQLRLQEPGTKVTRLSGAALNDAAFTMRTQNELLDRASRPKDPVPTLEKALGELIEARVHGQDGQRLKAQLVLENGMNGEVNGRVSPRVQ